MSHNISLVDTHCHLNIMVKKEFGVVLSEEQLHAAAPLIETAAARSVNTIVNVGTDLIESKNCIALAQRCPGCWAVIGIHPCDYTAAWQNDLKEFETLPARKDELKIVAIGEIGFDTYHKPYNLDEQRAVFRAQIELALKHDLPIVIHSRDAAHEALAVLEEYRSEKLRGILHCFSYDLAVAQQAIDLGFVISIGGPITYPQNIELQRVVTTIPLNKLVFETDSPFLPIQRMRGTPNSPQHIADIAAFIAQLRSEPFEQVALQTTQTALSLFKITGKQLY